MSVTGSNPMSTKDDIVAALVVSGIHTFAIHGADAEAYRNFVKQTLACEPHIVIDDGGDWYMSCTACIRNMQSTRSVPVKRPPPVFCVQWPVKKRRTEFPGAVD